MCGILGIVSQFPQSNRGWLEEGGRAISHRGPDDSGEWWSADGKVGMGHRRLSIVDLSSGGHQPMHDETAGLTLVFNGEIYNFLELRSELSMRGHVFHSGSDTEVILKAYKEWDTECILKFNGMFAFALFDAHKSRVFLARDRAGEKPLFIYRSSGELRFSSELKALLADRSLSRTIDAAGLDSYLKMGFIPRDGCILKSFSKLAPAHAMTFDIQTGQMSVWRYWELPYIPDHQISAGAELKEALVDELQGLFQDAVTRQLVADVPVGILLSGGLDSSLITALAVRASPNVKTFTIGFPGSGTMDETEHARLIARHFKTEHIELMAEPATAELLPLLARQFDEPMADSSMFPTFLVSRLVRQHCKVALGGDGGDELFGGYYHYQRLLWMQKKFEGLPLSLRKIVASTATATMPLGVKGRNWLQALGCDLSKGVPLIGTFFDQGTRRHLVAGREEYNRKGFSESGFMGSSKSSSATLDLLQRATRMDFNNYLADDILVKVDRASMMNSLEVRAPFLDYRLIEFAFGKVPSELKATALEKKILLKRLSERLLPPQFDRQRKQGFSIPLADWLKSGPFRELFWSVLTDSNCMFNPRIVNDLLNGQDKGRNNGERLFALVQFELWRKEYNITNTLA
jgi:asparagine synthase (glutamine-hydrolysing)